MPSENGYYFGYYFFAPQGRFQPCGMFTLHHIIGAVISVAAVIFLLYLKRKSHITVKSLRIITVAITLLEAIKISHSFIYGDYYLDAWFPLSYCGLFIFALWICVFCRGKIKRAAEVFIAYGCPLAGLLFLICPTTSLMIFPIWHYFSLYSLFFHSMMMYIGISFLKDEARLTFSEIKHYACFVIAFSVPAIILNSLFESNLMNLREPYNIPIRFLHDISNYSSLIYSLFVIFLFLLLPVVTALAAKRIKFKRR